ncbi:amidase [Carboxylicivirga mesophila]|uniref:Amidase n=1 Tax=Carboxylicivirga mesophila TaxID=1166478 RepID=A0ABS5KBS0_9BACT|nr:amidase [Carboxylicivirga mesophila]MBS2211981.1 amidase [Carboxylicivirga mesophila]
MISRRSFIKRSFAAGAAAMVAPAIYAKGTSALPTQLVDFDALGLSQLIKNKEVSPKEVVMATINRIEALDGKLNAINTPTFEKALETVKNINPDAPFAGVPFVMKDNINYAGVKTTNGSKLFENNVAKESAQLTKAYEKAGFVILGKTNMPEFGLAPTTESVLLKPAHNPWNTEYSSGGSSGGSSISVAAGYLPLAHASDGGGSIRIPASSCGIFGLKPSRMRMLPGSSDQLEFMVDNCVSRTVRDSAMLFSLTQNPANPANLKPVGFVSGPSKRRLTIGLCMKNYFGELPHPEIQKAIEDTAKLLESLGHTVIEVKNPVTGEFEDQFLSLFAAKMVKTAAFVQQMTGKPAAETGLLEPFTLEFDVMGRKRGNESVIKANKYFEHKGIEVANWMNSFDVLLTPVTKTPSPKLGYMTDSSLSFDDLSRRIFDYMSYTPVQNALGLPGMSVPLGMSSNGLPIGSHFAAGNGDEQTLLELAYELEAAKPWAHKWAPVSAKINGLK